MLPAVNLNQDMQQRHKAVSEAVKLIQGIGQEMDKVVTDPNIITDREVLGKNSIVWNLTKNQGDYIMSKEN